MLRIIFRTKNNALINSGAVDSTRIDSYRLVNITTRCADTQKADLIGKANKMSGQMVDESSVK